MTRCAAGLVALVLATACGEAPAPSGLPACGLALDGDARARDVVLIVSDTMRRDVMGIHGGRARTPAFDAFASAHLWFGRAVSQAPWTKPSVATLFTSLYPSQHRVTASENSDLLERLGFGEDPEATQALSGDFVTLAEVLDAAGYETAGFVGNPWLGAELGFAQGFDHWDDSFAGWAAPGTELSERALAWLARRRADAPLFLYLHYMDAHRPYPELTLDEVMEVKEAGREVAHPLDGEERQIASDLVHLEGDLTARSAGIPTRLPLLQRAYQKGVEAFDAALGVFLDGFDALPGSQDAAVLVTSDHGEALFEHGIGNHGRGLHDEEIAVPFAARLPGVRGDASPLRCGAGLVDVLPTLCGYLGVACPESVQGVSLLAGPGGRGEPRYQVSEGVTGQPEHRAVVGERWKLLYEPGSAGERGGSPWSLYDLEDDPGEQRNLLRAEDADEPARTAFRALSPVLETAVAPYAAPEAPRVTLDPARRERLRALGYLGSE